MAMASAESRVLPTQYYGLSFLSLLGFDPMVSASLKII